MDLAYWVVAAIGHLGISTFLFNQIHSTSLPRRFRKQTEKVLFAITVFLGAYLVSWMCAIGTFEFWKVARRLTINQVYLTTCLIAGVVCILVWMYRKLRDPVPANVTSQTTEKHDIQKMLGRSVYIGKKATFISSIPGNRAHVLSTERVTLAIPQLPDGLTGLKICHLSDFHLTGQIDLAYFQEVARKANEFKPDVTLITGDLVDEMHCLDWIDDIFGQLSAVHGVFYVLGNHDRRVGDETMLRQRLAAAGLKAVSGHWETIHHNGAAIALSGNELPWFTQANQLQPFKRSSLTASTDAATPTQVSSEEHTEVFKILLSHSPDQLTWAREFGFDLMFAGHTHGGQVRIPIIGPIVAPSKYGTRYASGTFLIGEMLMRVSRGISGDKCLRVNCPPEVGLITLTGSQSPK